MRIKMILAVSDIHLGYEKCNREAFSEFLDEIQSKDIEHFIILGDLFDLWRRNNVDIILENEDILEKLLSLNAQNFHYIVGNHDFYLYKLGQKYQGNFPFPISKNLRLHDGGIKFYFTHGYELEVLTYEPLTLEMYEDTSEKMCFDDKILGGFVGQAWEIVHGNDFKEKIEGNITEKLGMTPHERFQSSEEPDKIIKFANSKSKGFLLGMQPDEILVFGHTHDPYLASDGTVVNTGSWVHELEKEYQNSYLEIKDGNIELKFFASE